MRYFTEPDAHNPVTATFFKSAIRTAARRATRLLVPSKATRDELVRETILYRTIAPEDLVGPKAHWQNDLAGQLEQYVRKYYTALLDRESLVRAVVGEGRLLPPAVRQAVLEKMAPMRAALIERLHAAKKAGCIRPNVDLGCAVDILRDTVHTGMLRHTMYGPGDYSVDTYLRTVVAIFIQGVRKP